MKRVSPGSERPILLDHIRSVAVFVAIVEQGSFRAAAAQLDLSQSVASQYITTLETQLGVTLLYRTTRRLSLTTAGSRLLKSAQALVRTTEQTLRELAAESRTVIGSLHIVMPTSVALSPVMGVLWAFAARNLSVRFAFHVAENLDHPAASDADVTFRMGSPARSASLSQLLHHEPRRVLGAPRLVAQMPKPVVPADLAAWPWIAPNGRRSAVELFNAAGERVSFKTHDVVTADAAVATLQLTIAGAGLSLLPLSIAEPALAEGRLAEVLPAWRPLPAPVHAHWGCHSSQQELTSRLVSFLQERLLGDAESRPQVTAAAAQLELSGGGGADSLGAQPGSLRPI